MAPLISHPKNMSLDLSLSPIQVFDGKNKIHNSRPSRKQQTKFRGTMPRFLVRVLFSF